MESQVSRRLFVGTVGAGLPLLVASVSDGQEHQHNANDLVGRELRKQMKASIKALGGPRHGEASRRLASSVRVAVAHNRAGNLDAQLIAALQKIVRARGRDALVTADVAPSRLAAEARELEVTVPTLAPFDYNQRSAVLAGVMKNGVTGSWEKAADAFDLLGAEADRNFVGIKTVARRLDDQRCIELAAQLQVLQDITTIACNPFTIGTAPGQAACAYAFSIWMGFRASYSIFC